MSRVLLLATCLLIGTAHADPINDSAKQLANRGSVYKVRLASALALAKSKDPRAIIALADALSHDSDDTVRRVAALALEKMVDASTPNDARELALTALDAASKSDLDAKVRDTATKTLKVLTPFRRGNSKATPTSEPRGNRPEVFVQVDAVTDQSKKVTGDTSDRMAKIVRKGVERTGYATAWPGGPPTSAQLTSAKSRAFIVASSVKKIEITKASSRTEVACTITIRMSPWGGKDGGERWEANRAASASGSAKATTGNNDREVTRGIRDCLEAVAEDVTQRQVVPFLKRLASAGS
ncbi:MAG: HEAT repeat domain-containing protein [Deltaproteobacteria bacterium]|nr:HEAT repeat domain-containing protein [Deltaproteobacteria bacterium]